MDPKHLATNKGLGDELGPHVSPAAGMEVGDHKGEDIDLPRIA